MANILASAEIIQSCCKAVCIKNKKPAIQPLLQSVYADRVNRENPNKARIISLALLIYEQSYNLFLKKKKINARTKSAVSQVRLNTCANFRSPCLTPTLHSTVDNDNRVILLKLHKQ